MRKRPCPESSASQRLDCLHRFRGECQIAAGQILLHMLSPGGAGQRNHPDAAREAKHSLGWSDVRACGEIYEPGIMQHLHVGGEQRETLIANMSSLAKQ